MQGARSPLKRHLLIRLMLAGVALSALLLLVFLAAYRSQLVAERSRASLGFNLLLQAALENAMLKRDVPGLAEIVARLGEQPEIHEVTILNPAGDVRFASTIERIGRHLPALVPKPETGPSAEFTLAEDGTEVLRSINPVRNKAPCEPCHGKVSQHPVNGILVVDYDAGGIRAQAWKSALAFAAAGIAVLAIIMAVLWRSLNHRVLAPVAALTSASGALEGGQLGERVQVTGDDELAALGRHFNRMASRIENQIDRLSAHEAYLQDVLDGLPDGVRVIRVADLRVVLVNRAFCLQTGLDAVTALGLPCHRSSHGREAPCIPTLVACPLHEITQTGGTLKSVQHHRRADGSQFPAEIHAMQVDLDTGRGKEAHVVETIRDLGRAAHISHEQRLSELGLLAAGIAHEIHNPLGSVRLGVQGLARDMRSGQVTPEQIIDYLGLIDQEIDNCIAVTRRLLLLARPPANSLQLVVIGEALTDTLRLLEFDAHTRGIAQIADLPEEPLRLLADESEIRMIFLNLIQNAHHAMPKGGTLTARLQRDGDDAVIEMIDNGIGMAADLVARIFDPFFSRRADGVSGTGLGLTIVKNFIERNGGTITVDSTLGQGSCFRIRLPLADRAGEGMS